MQHSGNFLASAASNGVHSDSQLPWYENPRQTFHTIVHVNHVIESFPGVVSAPCGRLEVVCDVSGACPAILGNRPANVRPAGLERLSPTTSSMDFNRISCHCQEVRTQLNHSRPQGFQLSVLERQSSQRCQDDSAVSAASRGSLSTGPSTTLSMYCSGCASAVFIALSMSCICGTSTVFFRILNLVFVAAVGNVDRIVCSFVVVTSRRCVLSWPTASRTMGCEIVFSAVSPTNPKTWTVVAAAASGWFCRVLFVALNLACSYPLSVRSFLTRRWSALFSSSSLWCLSKAAGDFSLFSSVRRTLHDVLMALHELLRGELFARARSSTCCAWLLGLPGTTLSLPPLRSHRCPAPVRSLRA